MKVAVVGGGVVGMACAYELARGGAEVVVLDKGSVGHGASFGNTGWVCPSFAYPLPGPGVVSQGVKAAFSSDGPLAIRPGVDPSYLRWLWSFRRSCTRERWLAGVRAFIALNRPTLDVLDGYRAAGVEFEMHSAGLLLVGIDPKKVASYTEIFRDLASAGFEGGLRELAAGEARELEPALSDRIGGGVLAEIDRVVHPLSLTTGLAAWAVAHGAEIRERVEVRSVTGRRVETTNGAVDVDAVVLAAGVDSGPLLRRLGVRVGIAPARGYSVTFARATAEAPARALYLADALVGLSSYDDAVRIAGVFELGHRSLEVHERRLDAMLRTVDPFFSRWKVSEAPRDLAWAGLRPLTSDGLPLIGRAPRDPGVFLATGHGMLGMTLAPATAALLAPLVLAGRADPALAPFDPGRKP
jgi:D-amino-acid dehydrogenase